jgi:hypothetical protein
MKRNKILIFVVATVIAFVAFSSIAHLIETTRMFNTGTSLIIDYDPIWEVVDDYRIEVQHMQSIWHLEIYTITVRNGQIVESESRCVPAPFEGSTCVSRTFEASDFTLNGLFATANDLAARYPDYVTVTYDETYGFPIAIHYNDPQIVDEDRHWQVLSFEPL